MRVRSVLPLFVVAVGVGLFACADSSDPVAAPPAFDQVGGQALPLEAEVEFGIEEGSVGTGFPPASHDRSFHAFDMIRPRTVTIAAGGTVHFEIYPLHQPAIYEPGTTPSDINTTATEPIPVLPFLERITDADGRIALGPNQAFFEQTWSYTFPSPGRYLVICTTWVHFVEANMYAWVIVK